jgi:hypothetical protein
VLGDEHIINDNERFNPTAACCLEDPNKIGGAMYWEKQELKAKLSARSFNCAHGNICARVRFVPEHGRSRNARESLFEHCKPFSA